MIYNKEKLKLIEERNFWLDQMRQLVELYKGTGKEQYLETAKMVGQITNRMKQGFDKP